MHKEVEQICKPISLDMTLGELSDKTLPYYLWMKYIDHKIMRSKDYLPCWIWRGRRKVVPQRGTTFEYPIMTVRVDENNPRRGTKEVYVRRYGAALFWKFPDDWVIYRDQTLVLKAGRMEPLCKDMHCLNPEHWVISHRNDRDLMNKYD